MRKFVRADISGYSTKYGIRFTDKDYAVASYREEETNEIKTIVMRLNERKDYEKYFKNLMYRVQKQESFVGGLIYTLFSIVCMLVYFYISFNLQLFLARYGLYEYFYIFFILCSMIFIARRVSEFLDSSKYYKLTKYHGAEHKAFNALEITNRPYDFAIVKNQKRYHPRCGVSVITNIVCCFIVFYIIHLVFHSFMPPIIFMVMISRLWPFGDPFSYFIQMKYTTEEPTSEEIEVAMCGINRLLEIENGSPIKEEEECVFNKILKIKEELSLDFGNNMDSITWDHKILDENYEYFDKKTEEIQRQQKYERELFSMI